MKQFLRRANRWLSLFGLDLKKAVRSLRGLPFYLRDLRALKRQQRLTAVDFPLRNPFPCLDERDVESGTARGHYFHQDLLVARRIYRNRPRRHVDAGSRIDGFVAHVASFREIEVLDLRQLSSEIPNVTFVRVDLTEPLGDELVDYCDSVSSLHAIEHFGLGRYGDPVRLDGHVVALDNVYRMLQPGGRFYFSVPIGPQRIEFNAHRVFSLSYLLSLIRDRYQIDSFSFVDDEGDLHEDVALRDEDVAGSFGCYYGCGIFEMTKT